jgi:hypothetical protein
MGDGLQDGRAVAVDCVGTRAGSRVDGSVISFGI